jgi:VWFA-related protein
MPMSAAPPVQQASAFGGSVQNDQASLAQMAEATGGTPYFNRNDLDAALREAIATGADYYSLAYVPPLSGYDGKFHSIAVRVDKPNVQLEYRRGYVSVDPAKVPNSPQLKH